MRWKGNGYSNLFLLPKQPNNSKYFTRQITLLSKKNMHYTNLIRSVEKPCAWYESEKILKMDFSSHLVSRTAATFKGASLDSNAHFGHESEHFGENTQSVPSWVRVTQECFSLTRVGRLFYDCFIHESLSNWIIWFCACYLGLGWSEHWHSMIGLADPCTRSCIIQPRNLIWFGKDRGM